MKAHSDLQQGNRCPLCNSERQQVFNTVLLKRHAVDYYYCNSCGLLQTETPWWLEEAYTEAIADADTGLIARNQGIARKLAALLYCCFDRQGHYIDSAGGYGMLTRLMRDIGFDFYWHDDYCRNLFARGFEADKLSGAVSAVTAFEVLEHVQDPLQFLSHCLQENTASTIIFSTELFRGDPPAPSDWWYYTPDTGQHISFYQRRTLEMLASKLSLRLYSHRNLHILTERRINTALFRLMTGRLSWPGYAWARLRMTSRTFPDHQYICSKTGPADTP